MKKILLSLLAIVAVANFSYGQQIAVKTNLIPWIGGMGNFGVEFSVAPQWTVSLHGAGSPFPALKYDNFRTYGYTAGTEVRYYTCRAFNGHHFGVYGYGGYMSRVHDNWGILDFGYGMSDENIWRHNVKMITAGISYGYYFKINSTWGIDTYIGVGYMSLKYRDGNASVATSKEKSKDMFYPSKAGISVSYKF